MSYPLAPAAVLLSNGVYVGGRLFRWAKDTAPLSAMWTTPYLLTLTRYCAGSRIPGLCLCPMRPAGISPPHDLVARNGPIGRPRSVFMGFFGGGGAGK